MNMPIPLIALGVAAVIGGAGVYKGAKAVEKNNQANSVQNSANRLANNAKRKMVREKDRTKNLITSLGNLKINISNREIKNFVNLYSQLKDVKLNEMSASNISQVMINAGELQEMKKISMTASKLLTGSIGGLSTGALLGWGTYGGVMALGTASTGTAISGLSGAAATNATLAWLGGGSIAAGGGGIALGSVVLGGIIAAPAVLLAGCVFDSQDNTKLDNAKSNLAKAKTYASDVDKAVSELKIIQTTIRDYELILKRLKMESCRQTQSMSQVIYIYGVNWKNYDSTAKTQIFLAVKAVQALKAAVNTPLLTKNGILTRDIKNFIIQNKRHNSGHKALR